MPHTLPWFINRIGKRIYRNARPGHEKDCPTCAKVAKEGLIVADKMHACYLFDTENDFGCEGVILNYRDNL